MNKDLIVKQALVRAGVIPFDQVPTSNQGDQVETVLVSMHEQWVDDGTVRWELDNIPTQLEDPLISLLAFYIADDFSIPSAKYARLEIAATKGLSRLQDYNAAPYTGNSEIQAF